MRCLTIVLLCLPAFALANLDRCRDLVTLPSTGTSSYRSYLYELGPGGVACTSAELTCIADIPNQYFADTHMDRTWFLTDNKAFHGIAYSQNFLQLYNIQCPAGDFLHLYPQKLNTESSVTCDNGDFVTVSNPEIGGGEETFCGEQSQIQGTELFNGGLGRFVTTGNATVEFCTNANGDVGFGTGVGGGSLRPQPTETDGFTVRATCVNPSNHQLPGCTDIQFVKDWDPEWLFQHNEPFEKPGRITIPHKRSIQKQVRKHKKRWAKRAKRSFSLQTFEFEEGQTVSYQNGKFTFQFNNGSLPFTPEGEFSCLDAYSDFIGTRKFFFNSSIVFTGPGKLELDNKRAVLRYTVNSTDPGVVNAFLLPGDEIMSYVNRIYDYIFDCWVAPYPVVSNASIGNSLPLPNSDTVDDELRQAFGRVKQTSNLGFLQEQIGSTGTAVQCHRGTIIRRAPAFSSKIPFGLFTFCQYYYNACNTLLRAACQELIGLDPVGSGK